MSELVSVRIVLMSPKAKNATNPPKMVYPLMSDSPPDERTGVREGLGAGLGEDDVCEYGFGFGLAGSGFVSGNIDLWMSLSSSSNKDLLLNGLSSLSEFPA